MKYILHVITTNNLNFTAKSFKNTFIDRICFLCIDYGIFLSLKFRMSMIWHQSCNEVLLNFKITSFTLVFFLHITQAFIHIPQSNKNEFYSILIFFLQFIDLPSTILPSHNYVGKKSLETIFISDKWTCLIVHTHVEHTVLIHREPKCS